MDYSDLGYSEYDCLDEFTISQIAFAFSRIGKDKHIRSSKRNVITDALKQAISKGKLKSSLQVDDDSGLQYISPDDWRIGWLAIRIQRIELEKWFESKGQKPPFLFPEARNQEGASKPRETKEEQLDPRERTTLLQIIAVLAAEAKLDLTKHSKAAGILLQMGGTHGLELPVKQDTIADKFKEARDLQKTR